MRQIQIPVQFFMHQPLLSSRESVLGGENFSHFIVARGGRQYSGTLSTGLGLKVWCKGVVAYHVVFSLPWSHVDGS